MQALFFGIRVDKKKRPDHSGLFLMICNYWIMPMPQMVKLPLPLMETSRSPATS